MNSILVNRRTTLREKLSTERWMQRSGLARSSRVHLHNIVAEHSLSQDSGYEGEPDISYQLDEETRDRLIAHARQDASRAAVISAENDNRIIRIERLLWVIILVVGVSILFVLVK